MSDITRDGLKRIIYELGQAHDSIYSKLGDLNKNPGIILGLEAILCRLRGSTLFYNDDYRLPRYTINNVPKKYYFVKFPSSDILEFGLQGAFLTKNYAGLSLAFPTPASGWNPGYYGPPSPEGLNTWYYNAWKGYAKDPPDSNFENGNYSDRYGYEFPVRYLSNSQSYSRVAYFEHARWISIFNSSGTTRNENDYVYVFELPKNTLNGIKIINPETDNPIDVRFMYFNKLLQKYESSSWQQIDVNFGLNSELNYLAHKIEDIGNSYRIKINIPSDLVFDPAGATPGGNDHHPQTWWHFIMYWGSKDSKAIQDVVTFNSAPPELTLNNNEVIVWAVKHFFDNTVNSKITWENAAINDSSVYSLTGQSYRYLVAMNRVHAQLNDITDKNLLTPPKNPYKYNLSDNILSANTNFSNNSISNYSIELKIDEYQSAILMAYTYGYNAVERPPFDYSTPYEYIGDTEFKLKLGPKFSADESRYDWENFEYYPKPDPDYFVFARLIIKRAKASNYGAIENVFVSGNTSNIFDPLASNQTSILQTSQIVWIEQIPPSFAIKPHGDVLLSSIILPSLYQTINNLRFNSKELPIVSTAAKLLLIATRTPSTIASSLSSILNPDDFGSILFRKLLKNPIDPLLQPETDEPLAIQFSEEERIVIEQMMSIPPSTEILRLNADNLFIIGNKLNKANTFEIYHEPTDQCTAADNQTTGTRVGLDYTLRMKLEDSDENVLQKDWYIMASKYLLTQEEYNNRIEKEQTTVGYFTVDKLNDITEWRLQGYRSIVPDLSMGEHRVLINRMINPPDDSVMTESKFRANLAAQGFDIDYINDAVLQYIEDNGEFAPEADTRSYDNKFIAIREAALNISTFTEGIPYWQSNIKNFFFRGEDNPSVGPFYSDSFTLALEGVSGADLDSFGKQAVAIYSFTPASPYLDLTLHFNNHAFVFNSGNINTRMTTVGLKMKASLFDSSLLTLTNNGTIKAKLYSSTLSANTGFPQPNSLLVESTTIIGYKDLSDNVYSEFYWNFDYSLNAFTDYWIVLTLDSTPQNGDIKVATNQNLSTETSARLQEFQAFSFTNNADTNAFTCAIPINIFKFTNNTTTGLTNSSGSINIKIFESNVDGSIGNEFSFTSANASINFSSLSTIEKFFTFNATANFIAGVKYWVALIPSERPRGGQIIANLSSVSMNPVSFTQNQDDNNSYTKWNFWINEGANYKAWMKVDKIIPEVYGYFNRQDDDLSGYLPRPNLNRIANTFLTLEGTWAFTIKEFPQPSRVFIYPRYIPNPAGYVNFKSNIYVHIRLEVGGTIKDYRIHLDPNATPVPIAINGSQEKADRIVYMYVAKDDKELDNGYHGAPPGDRLIIRSS